MPMRRHKRPDCHGRDLAQGRPPDLADPEPESMLITSGPMLCSLRVWTDEQWDELPESARPAQSTRVPGLGWVGAVPVACLN
jgi:hypothetical protein